MKWPRAKSLEKLQDRVRAKSSRLDGRGQGIGATHQRWPNEWFARCGLLSLAAGHEWTRTSVGRRTH